jgi:hypothetical protein
MIEAAYVGITVSKTKVPRIVAREGDLSAIYISIGTSSFPRTEPS